MSDYERPPTIQEEFVEMTRIGPAPNSSPSFSSQSSNNNNEDLDTLVYTNDTREQNIRYLLSNQNFLSSHNLTFSDKMSDINLENLTKLIQIAVRQKILLSEFDQLENSVNLLQSHFQKNKKPKKCYSCNIC